MDTKLQLRVSKTNVIEEIDEGIDYFDNIVSVDEKIH